MTLRNSPVYREKGLENKKVPWNLDKQYLASLAPGWPFYDLLKYLKTISDIVSNQLKSSIDILNILTFAGNY